MQPTSAATHHSHSEAKLASQTAALSTTDRNHVPSLRIIVSVHDPVLSRDCPQLLSRLGHEVCLAATGRQLLDQCVPLRPDLVIIEPRSPEQDGFAAAEEIARNHPRPIILVPGDDHADAVERALDNPCVLACLSRPIKELDLRLALGTALRRFQQYQAVCREAAELRQTLEERKLIERAKGLVMRYADLDEQEAFARLRRLASNQNRKLIDAAQSVLSAGEVFEQLASAAGEKSHDGPPRSSRKHRPN